MKRITLPVCLLLLLVAGSAAAAPREAESEQVRGEKLVLGLLGMIGSEKPEKVARARRLLALQPDAYKLRPLAVALRCRPASLRIHAAGALARLGTPRAVVPLVHRAVREVEPRVRRALAQALRDVDEPGVVPALARALGARDASLRLRAIEMLGLLGDLQAVPHLLTRWEARGGDFPRSHFSQVQQVAYLQDFDVEVSATSFIADPHVGILQPGVVQDVKVIATEQVQVTVERARVRAALVKLAGRDHGRSIRSWKRWWAARERVLEAPPAASD